MQTAVREHMTTGWSDLEGELDAWRAAGRCATFWWRDDDATRPGPRLARLFECANGAPVSLAVIPATVTAMLDDFLRQFDRVTILQHGYAHTNHAPADAKKSEFGDHRALPEMIGEITAGHGRLLELFEDRFLPVFVPPWNRMSDALSRTLPQLGFLGLSSYGPRPGRTGVATLNCHADPIAWRGDRGFMGEDAILDRIVGHLSARRLGTVDASEATGLLTHHRDHDAGCWRFIESFAALVADHPAAQWIPSQAEFSDTGR